MKNSPSISLGLTYLCTLLVALFASNLLQAQQVTKVGTGEYVTNFLRSNGQVGVYSQSSTTPTIQNYVGIDSIVALGGGQYHVTALDQRGKVYKLGNTHTAVSTVGADAYGNEFKDNFLIRGFWRCNVSIRKPDSSLWYWGEYEVMNLAGGGNITAPIKLNQPAGIKFKKIETASSTSPGTLTFIYALASNGTLWKYNRGSATPTQVVIQGETIVDFGIASFYGIIAITASNKIYAWGNFDSRYVGAASHSATPVDITSRWTSVGVKFPILEIGSAYNVIHIIDADNNLFASGSNQMGDIGNGFETPNLKSPTGTNSAWGVDFAANGQFMQAPLKLQGKVKNIQSGTTITFYHYVQDMAGNWYSWGRNKGFALANGISLWPYAGIGTGDYAKYPNAKDIPMPKKVSPLVTNYTVTNFNAEDDPFPVVGAGFNQYISAATSTLYGLVHQQEFGVASTTWTKVSGPSGGTITSPANMTTTVTGLSTGTYIYRLSATNTNNQTSTDEVTIVVSSVAPPTNVAPSVNAGTDQNISLPTSTTTLSGTGTDADGTIASYLWTKVSGPSGGTIASSTQASTAIAALQSGVYTFSLRVTDNAGATAADTVRVTVAAKANLAPVANAGNNINITMPVVTAALKGSGTDSDGTIASYAWAKISGPAAGTLTNANTANATVAGLAQGTYSYQLTVTDNGGATGRDTVNVNVNAADLTLLPAVNPANTVNGLDYKYYEGNWNVLPVFSALSPVKSGFDNNFNISLANRTSNFGFSFTGYITVPADGQYKFFTTSDDGSNLYIDNVLTVANDGLHAEVEKSGLIGLKAGKHAITGLFFQQGGGSVFKVSYEAAGISKQVIPASVLHRANSQPTSSAGADKTLTLPVNTTTLNGSGADLDGTISSYAWVKLSGPTAGTISNANTAVATVSGLVQGVYSYQLTVTDNAGGTGRDTMRVQVNNSAITLLPAVNPANTVNGLNYKYYEGNWNLLPAFASLTPVKTGYSNNFDISVANKPTHFGLSFTGYITVPADGQYKFFTTSDDGSNLYIDDVLTVASDGLHAELEKSGVIGLKAGKHAITGLYFQQAGGKVFTVSYEGSGITKQVIPAASLYRVNAAPVSNAGADKTLTLPTNSTTLSGSGTDADGIITAYQWSLVSGPAGSSLLTANSQTSNVSFTNAGTYVFQLSITDNNGLRATDNVQVIVEPAVLITSKVVNVNLDNGTVPYVTSQWNSWTPVAGSNSSNFKYSDGSQSSVFVTMPQGGSFSDNGANYATAAAPNPPATFRISSMHTITRLFTVNGLNPDKQYGFEFYGSRAFNSGSKSVFTTGNFSDTIDTDFNQTDFARFSNLRPDNSGKIQFTFSFIGSYHYLSAFTVKELGDVSQNFSSAQPTPATSKQVLGENIVEMGADAVSVYPNPFVGSFKVQLNNKTAGEFVLKLSATSGQTVFYKKINKASGTALETINVSNLTPGSYILEIISVATGNKTIHKVIKN